MLIKLLLAIYLFSLLCALWTYYGYKFVESTDSFQSSYIIQSRKLWKAVKRHYLLYFTDIDKTHSLVISKELFIKLYESTNTTITLYRIKYKYWWANPNGTKVQYSTKKQEPKELHKKLAIKIFIWMFVVLTIITITIYVGI